MCVACHHVHTGECLFGIASPSWCPCRESVPEAATDTALMRRALEVLEECRTVVHMYAEYIDSADEDMENGEIYRAAGRVIDALNERLLAE